jgi:hypothetical protein
MGYRHTLSSILQTGVALTRCQGYTFFPLSIILQSKNIMYFVPGEHFGIVLYLPLGQDLTLSENSIVPALL